MAAFKGFNIKYPVYSVICPQTGDSYDVRCLTVAEVTKLKESLTTPASSSKIINETLWGAVESKPDRVIDFNSFKTNITLKDREALLYAMYQSTFGNERDFTVECGECSKTSEIKFHLDQMFSIDSYPGSKAIIDSYKVAKASDPAEYDPVMEKIINNNEVFVPSMEIVEQPVVVEEDVPVDINKPNISHFNHSDNDDDGIGVGRPSAKAIVSKPVSQAPPKEVAKPQNPDAMVDQFIKNAEKQKLEETRGNDGPPIENVSSAAVQKPGIGPKPVVQRFENHANLDDDEIARKTDIGENNVIDKRVRVTLPVSKLICVIKQPTIADEETMYVKIPYAQQKKQLELISQTLIIDRFEEYNDKGELVNVVNQKVDIVTGYQSLPTKDRLEIFKQYEENFSRYGIELKAPWTCNSCQTENEIYVDIQNQFFRMVAVS